MNKERELLVRALDALDGGPLYRLRLKEEIRDYLANANSSEAEPLAIHQWRKRTPYGCDHWCDASKEEAYSRVDYSYEARTVYLHPAPRKDFVRLSQEEIQTIYLTRYDTPNLFARAIEDALEEKNR